MSVTRWYSCEKTAAMPTEPAEDVAQCPRKFPRDGLDAIWAKSRAPHSQEAFLEEVRWHCALGSEEKAGKEGG